MYAALLLLNHGVTFLRMGQHQGGNEMRAGNPFGNRRERERALVGYPYLVN